MLRCTLSSLIPIINSEEYGSLSMNMLNKYLSSFEHIIKKESYYILRELPKEILNIIFAPYIPEIINKQSRKGTWKTRDGERISFDILKAIEKCDKLPNMNTGLKYDLYQNIKDKTDLYSVLLKDAYFNEKSKDIVEEKSQWINQICMNQMSNGSWYSTVIGTVVNIDYLLLLQVDKKDPIIQKGVEYLFANLNEIQIGDHVGKPYGFSARYMFSTKNRNKEFEIASQIKPEWIPRNICYRHLKKMKESKWS